MSEEKVEENFDVYRSSNNIKRKPDDSLIESECARFKVSGADFAIIHLSEIQRWLTITPVLQFNFHSSEKDAIAAKSQWQQKLKDGIFAKYVENTQKDEKLPTELDNCINALKERIPDRFPGRLPTITTLDPRGGIITTTQSRTVSSIQPISCPTMRFDLNPPELYYQSSEKHFEGLKPSRDAATHCCMFAELEGLDGVMNVPLRVKDKNSINVLTDAEVILNDLNTAEFILSRVIDDNMWKDRTSPFVVSFGRVNTFIITMKLEQLQDLLAGDFFVRYD